MPRTDSPVKIVDDLQVAVDVVRSFPAIATGMAVVFPFELNSCCKAPFFMCLIDVAPVDFIAITFGFREAIGDTVAFTLNITVCKA